MQSEADTKDIIAKAFRELLESRTFAKVTIGDICERCGISRRSFYYHFKDKYDMVVWIFRKEFNEERERQGISFEIDFKEAERWRMLCEFLERDRNYYRKIMAYQGQNSLEEFCLESGRQAYARYLGVDGKPLDDEEFVVLFFATAIFQSLRRWVMDSNPLTVDEYLEKLQYCLDILELGVAEKDA